MINEEDVVTDKTIKEGVAEEVINFIFEDYDVQAFEESVMELIIATSHTPLKQVLLNELNGSKDMWEHECEGPVLGTSSTDDAYAKEALERTKGFITKVENEL